MATSIKLFQFLQKYCQAIGVESIESNKIHWKKLIFFMSEAIFFASLTVFMSTEANSMLDFGRTSFALACIVYGVALCIIHLWQIENFWTFIENCEKFIEKRQSAMIAYNELNGKIELFCKVFCFVYLTTPQLMVLSILIFSIVNYYIFDLGAESFYLVFPVVMPFDWKTPYGYPVAWVLQSAGGFAVYLIVTAFFEFMVGSCWLFICIAEDITNELMTFNGNDDAKENHVEKLQKFYNIIEIYSDAKQLIIKFKSIYEYLLFSFFAWALFTLSCMLVTLQFQLWDENSNTVEIAITSLFVIWEYVSTCLICEPGERVTDQFEMFGQELGRCNWYRLSLEMQRIYVNFLLDTQQPISINSYGGIQSTRETLKKVITKGYSYFAALRQMK